MPDRRTEAKAAAGTHALIVGISRYDNLPLKGFEKTEFVSIDFTARSAMEFAKWILASKDRLAAPLTTCRVLLAPSDDEREDLKGLGADFTDGTLSNFMKAVAAWRYDALQNPDNVMIFYFAGHALELGFEQPVLVFQDFGRPDRPIFGQSVSLSNLVDGLAPSAWQRNIARQQFYFIDTDRISDVVGPLRSIGIAPRSTNVFDVPRQSALDDRNYCVLYATMSGGKAYADKTTIFNSALITCLEGSAASEALDREGAVSWSITSRSLVEGVQRALDQQLSAGSEERQRVSWSIRGQDTILATIETPPRVQFLLRIEPDSVASRQIVRIYDEASSLIAESLPPHESRRLEWSIPAGIYSIEISSADRDESWKRLVALKPPRTEMVAKI